MQTDNGTLRVAISRDESADWRVCGLRQIERITLALDHFAQTAGRQVIINEDKGDADLALSTRVVLARNSVPEMLNGNPAAAKTLSSPADIPAAEKWLARDLGKAQDGWVARHIDRRISTTMTRHLLRFGVRPLHATIGAFLFALAGCLVLLRGDYTSVFGGTVLFYAFSILDGCDGEIARALYSDSPTGARVDFIFDTIANVLFVISLGFGLAADRGSTALRWEGLATGLLIVGSELLLATGAAKSDQVIVARHSGIYERHARMLGHSGAFIFGERAVRFVVQLTKRDVAWLAFVVLAALNCAAWILHLSLVVAAATSALGFIAIIRQRAARQP
ncbi:MAG: hypothetical protein ACJ8KU_07575 [Chthoniobacterales bacterium]